MRRTVPQIDYIDKVPYRVADTRGTVNGKDTGMEGRGGPVDVRVCAGHRRVHRQAESGHGKGIGALRPRLDSAGRGRLVGG